MAYELAIVVAELQVASQGLENTWNREKVEAAKNPKTEVPSKSP